MEHWVILEDKGVHVKIWKLLDQVRPEMSAWIRRSCINDVQFTQAELVSFQEYCDILDLVVRVHEMDGVQLRPSTSMVVQERLQ